MWHVGAAGGVTQLASKVVVTCTPVGGRWGSRPAGRHCDGCWGGSFVVAHGLYIHAVYNSYCQVVRVAFRGSTPMWVAGGVSQLTVTGSWLVVMP